ncbi:nuclear pore complex protein DDB_G0274915-like isoform X2 [Teleopsis dalmanni]|uniref:nuclear pore complex protein DDB_G0274915-like isoform X2 n=1 Tax=Teleopsis dalmanni TaxID=139649 RepID=UPI0018CCEEB0|nr:nuclear pore complex protein DDB_G0274915-like isoform X2 [Teleopsis dalmanni]
MLSTSRQSPRQGLSLFWIIAVTAVSVTLWSGSIVYVNGAPAKLELQPPLLSDIDADAEAINNDAIDAYNSKSATTAAIDSYGNPIESLKPIDTPDGRKVVSAQGLQFEIPNYASGITDISKPADDLLPPFVEIEIGRNDSDNADMVDQNNNNNNNVSYKDNDVLGVIVAKDELKETPESITQQNPKTDNEHDLEYENNNNDNINTINKHDEQLKPEQQLQQLDIDNTVKANALLSKFLENINNSSYTAKVAQNFSTNSTTAATMLPLNNAPALAQPQRASHPSPIKISLFSQPYTQLHESNHKPTYTPIQTVNDATSHTTNKNSVHSNYHSDIPTTLSSSQVSSNYMTTFSPSSLSITSYPTSTSYVGPLSNGNFNYPNVPTDISIINRIAAKYHNPLPTLDPIVVALPNDSNESGQQVPTSGETTTVDIEPAQLVELIPDNLQTNSKDVDSAGSNTLPQYLLDLNDPDIAGPVEYTPSDDGSSLKVIAWDLLPPHDAEPHIITKENNTPKRVIGIEDPKTHNIKVSLSSGSAITPTQHITTANNGLTNGKVSPVPLNKHIADNLPASASNVDQHFTTQNNDDDKSQSSSNEQTPANSNEANIVDTTTKNPDHNRGNTYYTKTTPYTTTTIRTTRPTTTATTTTTTTTRRPTTTTTRRTTKSTTTTTAAPRTTAAPIVLTTTEPVDTSNFYRLENGDSYTLPSWLSGIDDPDLDAAVTFIIPTDLNEYNHTVDRDLLPPLEPFVDLKNINLPAPAGEKTHPTTTTSTTTSTTTTTTTTTTKRPSTTTTRRTTISTSRPHWVRAYPTTTTTPTTSQRSKTSNNDRFSDTSYHNAQEHDKPISSTTYTNSKPNTHVSTSHTVPPGTASNQNVNVFNQVSTTANTDRVPSSEADKFEPNPAKQPNPFLPTRNNGAYNFQPKPFSNRAPTTTTTTTTTTPATPVEENPFDSATVPAWLKDFDYPDVGPGVPFVYDPSDIESDVLDDLLPPSHVETDPSDIAKPVFVTSSPSSFNAFHSQPHFTHQQPSFNSASIPSKVTQPLPSTIPNNFNDNAAALTPNLAVEDANANVDAANKIAVLAKKPSPNFNNKHNFAAPFDTAAAPIGATTPADQESFPPFSNVGIPSKTKITKSDEGKVITNSVFLQGASGPSSAKPFGFGTNFNTQKDFQASQTNQYFSSTTDGFTSSSNTGFSPGPASSYSTSYSNIQQTNTFGKTPTGAGKYTGRFGGSPGVLGGGKVGYAVQPDGTIRDPDHTFKPPTGNKVAATPAPPQPQQGITPAFSGFSNRVGTAVSASNANKYSGRFGGPPGVLVPYDNVKAGRA